MVDLTSVMSYRVDKSGLDAATASVNNLAKSEDKLANTTARVTAVSAEQSKSVLSASNALDRFTRSNNELEKAASQVAQGQRLLGRALSEGATVTNAHVQGVSNAIKRYEELKHSTDAHTSSMSLNRAQTMELTHVGKSLVDQLAAGASPMRALEVEGGRIAQIFSEGSGGVGGTLKAIGSGLASAATGWLGMGAAAAAGAGLAVAALERYEAQQEHMGQALNGRGRGAGLTLGGITDIANSAATRNPALGHGGSTDLMAQLAGTGKIDGSMMGGIADLATQYSRATGEDMKQVSADFAKNFSDPIKGAEDFAEKLGTIDSRERDLITTLARSGDPLGAQAELMKEVAKAIKDAADNADIFTRARRGISSFVDSAANNVAENIRKSYTPNLQERRESAFGAFQGATSGFSWMQDPAKIADLTKQIADLDKQIAAENDRAKKGQQEVANSQEASAIDALMKKAFPDSARIADLNADMARLDKAMQNPAVLSRVPGSEISSAQGIYARQLDDLQHPLARIGDEAKLAVEAAQARTLAEHAAVDAQRAYTAALEASKPPLVALAEAEKARADAAAQAQRAIDDYNKGGVRAGRDAHMTPYDRGLQQIYDTNHDVMQRNGGGVGPLPRGKTSLLSPDDYRMTALDPYDALRSPGKLANRVDPALEAAMRLQHTGLGYFPNMPAADMPPMPVPRTPAEAATSIGSAAAGSAKFPGNTYVGNSKPGLAGYVDAYNYAQKWEPIDQANKSLDAQNAIFGIQSSGRSQSDIAGQVARQQLVNEYLKQGITPANDMAAALDQIAAKASAAAKQQEAFAAKVKELDEARQTVEGFMNTWVSGLAHGESGAKAFRAAMSQLGESLMNKGLSSLGDQLFGKSGSSGFGLIGSLFSGGGQPMQLSGAAGAGASGGGIGGLIGNMFGSLFSGAHLFADGGVMGAAGPLPLRKYAGG